MLRKDTVDMKNDPKERYTQKMGYHKRLRMVHMSKFDIYREIPCGHLGLAHS